MFVVNKFYSKSITCPNLTYIKSDYFVNGTPNS